MYQFLHARRGIDIHKCLFWYALLGPIAGSTRSLQGIHSNSVADKASAFRREAAVMDSDISGGSRRVEDSAVR